MATGVTYTAPQSTTPPSTPPQPPPKVCVNPVAAAAAGSNSVDNQYFYEDEVFRIDKKGRVKFGLVLENSETFSGDDADELDVLSKGEIRVIWHPEGKEEVITDRVVGLADRTLMPGDVVRRLVPGKDTQRGYCREINMRSDVRILGTKNIIKNVMAERLQPMVRMPRDSAVCLDSWVGSVKAVNEKIVLKSSCGALIEVSDLELMHFTDTNTKFRNGHFAEMVYYPGQVINGRLESMDNVKILSPTNKNWKPLSKKFRKFTVQSVRLDSVWVHWQCKALSEDGDIKSNLLQQPDPSVSGADLDRLKRLNLFESCMLQINDKSYLKFADCDVVVRKSVWEKEHAIKYKLLLSQQEKEEHLNKNQSRSTKAPTPFRNEKTKIKFSNSSLETPGQEKLPLRMSLKPLSKANLEKFNTSKERSETEKKTLDGESQQQQNQVVSADGWQTDEDEAEGLDDDDETESTATTISTCSSPTPRSSPKHTSRLQKKQVKKLKKTSSSASSTTPLPNVGDELVTESMMVYSTATVVWQDGAVETGIPSTQLYPIHHLDDHEFFPGDFVVCGKEDSDVSFRDYGVIQTVDHHGRTATVKWFTTYTSAVEPKPTYKGQSEMSVYDLKDHPDFQYRPGTMVIRVANFLGEDATCTAGQIIDNYIDGRVKVWWVDGHISMCWPQDLFEVGQYDHADWAHDTDDSWETESETSEFGGDTPQLKFSESHILSNFERARVAISRLEEIFSLNPNLQNHDVMRKLLGVYKNCRYLDRLMSTSFFHESHFMGLLERVGKDTAETVLPENPSSHERKNRLFSESSTQHSQQAIGIVVPVNNTQSTASSVSSPKDYAPKVIFNISSTPFKCLKKKATKSELTTPNNSNSNPLQEFTELQSPPKQPHNTPINPINTKVTVTDPSKNPYNQEKNKLLTSVMLNIEKATEKTNQLKLANNKSQDDSGNYTRTENCDGSSASYASSNDLTNIDTNGSFLKTNDDQQSVSCSSIEFTDDAPPEFVCIRLCCLLKEQLVKCINEIRQKYFVDNLNLSEIIENDIAEDLDGTIESTNLVVVEGDFSPQIKLSNDMNYFSSPETPTVEDPTETVVSTPNVPLECFQVLDVAPKNHKFELTILQPNNSQQYYKAIQREHRMLRSSLPPGVWVRVFEDRMDLVSVMIAGPKNTPYEDGMFFFDIQLGRDYPKSPPSCHYISYCSDRLNPNLYEDGKVCVSLLGTWSGRDTEVWGPNSTLLQVIVSIQGLILVAEPYFNEAGYEKQRGTQQGTENSRMYNEMAIIKLVQATTKLLSNPPPIFREQIVEHFKKNGQSMYNRIKGWMELSQQIAMTPDKEQQPPLFKNGNAPDFPLVPASRGFCLTVSGLLETFHKKLDILDASTTTTPTAVVEQP